MTRLPHEPTGRRLVPVSTDVAQAQERRRTSGQIRSIDDLFIIDPELAQLTVYDDTSALRVIIGSLEPVSPGGYGLILLNENEEVVVFYDTGLAVLYLASDDIYLFEGGKDPSDVAGYGWRFRAGVTGIISWYNLASGVEAELAYNFTTNVLQIDSINIELDGDVTICDASDSLAFFGETPATQASLIDATGGNAGSSPYTLNAIGGTGDDGNLNDNFAMIAAILARHGLVG